MGNTVNIKTKAFEFSNEDDTVYIHCRLDYIRIDNEKIIFPELFYVTKTIVFPTVIQFCHEEDDHQ